MPPFNIPRHSSRNRRTITQRIHNVMVILDVEVVHLERSFPCREIHRDGVLGNWNGPEEPAFRYARIEVVDLQVLNGTCENVESYERERPAVVAAILSDEFAAHESHVRFEYQLFRCTVGGSVRPGAAHGSPADKSVEICDGRRLGARSGQKEMEERPRRA